MADTFVKRALRECQNLNAEINKNTTISRIGGLMERNKKLAVYFEKKLIEELEHIKIAPDLDRDNNFLIDKDDLTKLDDFRRLFETAL